MLDTIETVQISHEERTQVLHSQFIKLFRTYYYHIRMHEFDKLTSVYNDILFLLNLDNPKYDQIVNELKNNQFIDVYKNNPLHWLCFLVHEVCHLPSVNQKEYLRLFSVLLDVAGAELAAGCNENGLKPYAIVTHITTLLCKCPGVMISTSLFDLLKKLKSYDNQSLQNEAANEAANQLDRENNLNTTLKKNELKRVYENVLRIVNSTKKEEIDKINERNKSLLEKYFKNTNFEGSYLKDAISLFESGDRQSQILAKYNISISDLPRLNPAFMKEGLKKKFFRNKLMDILNIVHDNSVDELSRNYNKGFDEAGKSVTSHMKYLTSGYDFARTIQLLFQNGTIDSKTLLSEYKRINKNFVATYEKIKVVKNEFEKLTNDPMDLESAEETEVQDNVQQLTNIWLSYVDCMLPIGSKDEYSYTLNYQSKENIERVENPNTIEKLFHLIHLDPFLDGSFLQGGEITENITYLANILEGFNEFAKQASLASSMSLTVQNVLRQITQSISIFGGRADDFNCNDICNNSFTNALSNNEDWYNYITLAHVHYFERAIALETYQKIMHENFESIIIPGGFDGSKPHAMMYQFRKINEDSIAFIVHNSGAGVNHHDPYPRFNNSNCTFYAHEFRFEDLKNQKKFFINHLAEVLFHTRYEYSYFCTEDEDIQPKHIYETVSRFVRAFSARPINPNTLYNGLTHIQYTDACSWECIISWLKLESKSESTFSILHAYIQLKSLEQYLSLYNHSQKYEKQKSINIRDAINKLKRFFGGLPAILCSNELESHKERAGDFTQYCINKLLTMEKLFNETDYRLKKDFCQDEKTSCLTNNLLSHQNNIQLAFLPEGNPVFQLRSKAPSHSIPEPINGQSISEGHETVQMQLDEYSEDESMSAETGNECSLIYEYLNNCHQYMKDEFDLGNMRNVCFILHDNIAKVDLRLFSGMIDQLNRQEITNLLNLLMHLSYLYTRAISQQDEYFHPEFSFTHFGLLTLASMTLLSYFSDSDMVIQEIKKYVSRSTEVIYKNLLGNSNAFNVNGLFEKYYHYLINLDELSVAQMNTQEKSSIMSNFSTPVHLSIVNRNKEELRSLELLIRDLEKSKNDIDYSVIKSLMPDVKKLHYLFKKYYGIGFEENTVEVNESAPVKTIEEMNLVMIYDFMNKISCVNLQLGVQHLLSNAALPSLPIEFGRNYKMRICKLNRTIEIHCNNMEVYFSRRSSRPLRNILAEQNDTLQFLNNAESLYLTQNQSHIRQYSESKEKSKHMTLNSEQLKKATNGLNQGNLVSLVNTVQLLASNRESMADPVFSSYVFCQFFTGGVLTQSVKATDRLLIDLCEIITTSIGLYTKTTIQGTAFSFLKIGYFLSNYFINSDEVIQENVLKSLENLNLYCLSALRSCLDKVTSADKTARTYKKHILLNLALFEYQRFQFNTDPLLEDIENIIKSYYGLIHKYEEESSLDMVINDRLLEHEKNRMLFNVADILKNILLKDVLTHSEYQFKTMVDETIIELYKNTTKYNINNKSNPRHELVNNVYKITYDFPRAHVYLNGNHLDSFNLTIGVFGLKDEPLPINVRMSSIFVKLFKQFNGPFYKIETDRYKFEFNGHTYFIEILQKDPGNSKSDPEVLISSELKFRGINIPVYFLKDFYFKFKENRSIVGEQNESQLSSSLFDKKDTLQTKFNRIEMQRKGFPLTLYNPEDKESPTQVACIVGKDENRQIESILFVNKHTFRVQHELCLKEHFIFEINEVGERTGFQLVNLHEGIPKAFELFSRFEGREFIEIYCNPVSGEIKVNLPRYDYTFIANADLSQFHNGRICLQDDIEFYLEGDENVRLMRNIDPLFISGFNNYFIFEKTIKDSSEKKFESNHQSVEYFAHMPYQHFIACDIPVGGNNYNVFDLHGENLLPIFYEGNRTVFDIKNALSRPKSQASISYKVIQKMGRFELMPHDAVSHLYLAYIYVARYDYVAAYEILAILNRSAIVPSDQVIQLLFDIILNFRVNKNNIKDESYFINSLPRPAALSVKMAAYIALAKIKIGNLYHKEIDDSDDINSNVSHQFIESKTQLYYLKMFKDLKSQFKSFYEFYLKNIDNLECQYRISPRDAEYLSVNEYINVSLYHPLHAEFLKFDPSLGSNLTKEDLLQYAKTHFHFSPSVTKSAEEYLNQHIQFRINELQSYENNEWADCSRFFPENEILMDKISFSKMKAEMFEGHSQSPLDFMAQKNEFAFSDTPLTYINKLNTSVAEFNFIEYYSNLKSKLDYLPNDYNKISDASRNDLKLNYGQKFKNDLHADIDFANHKRNTLNGRYDKLFKDFSDGMLISITSTFNLAHSDCLKQINAIETSLKNNSKLTLSQIIDTYVDALNHSSTTTHQFDVSHQEDVENLMLFYCELRYIKNVLKAAETLNNSRCIDKFRDFVLTILNYRMYDFQKSRHLLVFEYRQNTFIRKDQFDILSRMLSVKSSSEPSIYENVVMKISPGSGKTKVLLPLSVLKATGNNIIGIIVPSALIYTNLMDLSETLGSALNKQIHLIEFRSDTTFDLDNMKSKLKNLYYLLLFAAKNKEPVIMTPETVKSLHLQYLKMLDIYEKSPNLKDINPVISYIDKIIGLFKYRMDVVADEGDLVLYSKSKLIFAGDDNEKYSKSLLDGVSSLYQFMDSVEISENVTIGDVIRKGFKIENVTAAKSALIKELVYNTRSPLREMLYNSSNINDPDFENESLIELVAVHYLHQHVEFEFDNNGDKELIKTFDFYSKYFKDNLKSLLAVFKEEITNTLDYTLNMIPGTSFKYGVNYGVDNRPNASVDERIIAIPFEGNGVPKYGSEFGDALVIVNCTIQHHMQFHVSVDFEIFHQALKDVLGKTLDYEISHSSSEIFKKWSHLNSFYEELCLWESLGVQIPGLNVNDDLLIRSLHENLKYNMALKWFLIKEYILPKLVNYKLVYVSSSADLVSYFRTFQTFSATLFSHNTFHQSLSYQPELFLGSDGDVLAEISNATSKVAILPLNGVGDTVSSALVRYISNHENSYDIRAVIDISALFQGVLNADIASVIANHLHSINSDIQYVLYWENVSGKLMACKVYGNHSFYIELGKSDIHHIESTLSVTRDKLFTYYDQVHARGMDVTQVKRAKGLVCIDPTICLRDVIQASKRMRGLKSGQSLEFILLEKDKPFFLNGGSRDNLLVQDLIDHSIENEIESLLPTHFDSTIDRLRNIIRTFVIYGLMINKSSVAQSQLKKYFNFVFTEDTSIDPIINFGPISTVKLTETILDEYISILLSNFNSALKKANINLPDNLSRMIQNKIQSEKLRALSICRERMRSSEVASQSSQVTRDTKKNNDTSKQTQLTLESQLLDSKKLGKPLDHDPFPLTYQGMKAGEFRNMNFYKVDDLFPVGYKKFFFSSKIFISGDQMMTTNIQTSYLQYNKKPVYAVLYAFGKPEYNNEFIFTCLISTLEAKNLYESFLSFTPDDSYHYHVWVETSAGYLMFGDKPVGRALYPLYYSIKEQIHYFNGDVCYITSKTQLPYWCANDGVEGVKSRNQILHKDLIFSQNIYKKPYKHFEARMLDIVQTLEKSSLSKLPFELAYLLNQLIQLGSNRFANLQRKERNHRINTILSSLPEHQFQILLQQLRIKGADVFKSDILVLVEGLKLILDTSDLDYVILQLSTDIAHKAHVTFSVFMLSNDTSRAFTPKRHRDNDELDENMLNEWLESESDKKVPRLY